MPILRSAGGPVDQETWCQILEATDGRVIVDDQILSDEPVDHRLWTTLIRTVGELAAEDQTRLPRNSDGFDDHVSQIINDWMDGSLPEYHDLAMVLGEVGYFRDRGLPWDETMEFSGPPCAYIDVVLIDLKDMLASYPDARDAVTEELIQTFFTFWRSDFLRKIQNVAENIERSDL